MIAVRLFARANEAVALLLNRVLSWSVWVPILMLGSMAGVWLHQTDIVMLLLTIQTSVDAAATKTLQSHLRDADERRERILQEQVENIAALAVDIRGQNDLILDLMRDAERRDLCAAKRDKAMLLSLEAHNDLLAFLGEEVKTHGSHRLSSVHARKDYGAAKRQRKALGRSRKPKP
jgi:hypothetical protein